MAHICGSYLIFWFSCWTIFISPFWFSFKRWWVLLAERGVFGWPFLNWGKFQWIFQRICSLYFPFAIFIRPLVLWIHFIDVLPAPNLRGERFVTDSLVLHLFICIKMLILRYYLSRHISLRNPLWSIILIFSIFF